MQMAQARLAPAARPVGARGSTDGTGRRCASRPPGADRQCRHPVRQRQRTRNDAATPLKLKDDIYLNDVVQTAANSSLGITFNDATTFNLTANAKITIDHYHL